ncbi:hypothetical protein [Marinobacter sp. F3R08]|uniref:hypothetical protein n=1 Tax=Marinobacter sp. F3R08 TaxID=2841559 RepID=UPI001C0901C2|nr:hypothetical protein [Marinobacter sp. F3R08]MBU2952261.1 hypothetical protein [Marinobacter sp. F3R08]
MQNQIVQSNDSDLKDMMEERLDISASPIMNYHDGIVKKISATKYLYGYLADDQDAENPLEEWDGVGRVYTAHRFGQTHGEMQEALALDSDWEPDYELSHDFPDVLKTHWVKAAAEDSDFQQWCHENGRPPEDSEKLPSYYLNKARRFWRDTGGSDNYLYNADDVWDFEAVMGTAEKAAYKELLEAGKIGDPDRAVLDCYEHSGVAWSLSGGGMQCRWDTANGAGVWVPDESAREEIHRRGDEVYAFGQVVEVSGLIGGNRKPFFFKLDEEYGGVESLRFETWYEAYEALQSHIAHNKLRLPRKKAERAALQVRGRERAVKEIAQNCVELYNDYLNGRVFGIVVATFEVNDEGEPELQDDDAVWGFYGDDDAYDSLKQEIEARDD